MQTDEQMPFNELVKERRRQLGLTQEEFGKHLGISKAAVSAIEKGRNRPSPETYSLMVKKFNLGPLPITGLVLEPAEMFGSTGFKVDTPVADRVTYLPAQLRKEMVSKAALPIADVKDLYRGMPRYALPIPKFIGANNDGLVVEITGDDMMQPQLTAGCKILAKPYSIKEWDYAKSGIYVFLTKEEVLVKRLKPEDPVAQQALSNKSLVLFTDNPTAQNITIEVNKLVAMWQGVRIVDAPLD